MAIPPWLAPQNFVDAMAKGASAGLTRRGQSLAAGQHRAALALQRDQLQVATQQKAVEFMQAEARAAEALRQHNSLEAFRQQSLAEEQRMHALSAAAAQARQATQDRAQDAREAHMALMEQATNRRLDAQEKAQQAQEKQRAAAEALSERKQQLAEKKAENPTARTTALHMQLRDVNDGLKSAEENGELEKVAELDARRAEIEKALKAAGEAIVPSAVRVLEMVPQPPTKGWFGRVIQNPDVPTLVKRSPASDEPEAATPAGANAPAAAALTMPTGTNAPPSALLSATNNAAPPQVSATNQPLIVDWIYDPKTGRMVKKK